MGNTNNALGDFWIVWNPSGSYPPRVRHPSYSLALVEAKRLAQQNPDGEFFVMKPSARVIHTAFQITEFGEKEDSDNEIPF